MLNPAAAAAAAAAARHPVSNPIKLFYNHQNILQLHMPHLYFCMPIFSFPDWIFSKQKSPGMPLSLLCYQNTKMIFNWQLRYVRHFEDNSFDKFNKKDDLCIICTPACDINELQMVVIHNVFLFTKQQLVFRCRGVMEGPQEADPSSSTSWIRLNG